MTTDTVREGFEAMGHPIPEVRRETAYRAIKEMVPSVTNSEAWSLVERMAHHLEDDEPYKALKEATEAPFSGPPPQGRVDFEAGVMVLPDEERTPYHGQPGLRLDYTGALRLMASLLAGPVS
jgi:hypothetical protein